MKNFQGIEMQQAEKNTISLYNYLEADPVVLSFPSSFNQTIFIVKSLF